MVTALGTSSERIILIDVMITWMSACCLLSLEIETGARSTEPWDVSGFQSKHLTNCVCVGSIRPPTTAAYFQWASGLGRFTGLATARVQCSTNLRTLLGKERMTD